MAPWHPGKQRRQTPGGEEEPEPRPRRQWARPSPREICRVARATLPAARAAPGAGELGNERLDLPAAGNSPAGARSRPRVLRFPGSVADASQTLGNWREQPWERDEQRRRLRFGLRLRPQPYDSDSGDEPVVGGDQRADADAFFLPRRNRGAAALPPGVSARARRGEGRGRHGDPGTGAGERDGGARCPSRDRPALPGCPRLMRAARGTAIPPFLWAGLWGLHLCTELLQRLPFFRASRTRALRRILQFGVSPSPFFQNLRWPQVGPELPSRRTPGARCENRGDAPADCPVLGARCQAAVAAGKPGIAGNWAVCSRGGAHEFSIFSVRWAEPSVWLNLTSRHPLGRTWVFPPGRSRCPDASRKSSSWCGILSAAYSSKSR